MPDIAEVMAHPITQQLLRSEPILRLAYTGRDGAPRAIPLGYVWDGSRFVFWTIPHSAKVAALAADPRVALTIDVLGPPPRVLLVRGRAELSTVDGVPDGYLDASHRTLPAAAWADFDSQVRALYEQMTVVTITPQWAKLLDFETTAPSAVERLVRERGGR
jgi:Pyridoxamine 5'-phosphate oxidase